MKTLSLFISIVFFSLLAQSQNNISEALNSTVFPISSISPDSDSRDLSPIINILKNKSIVGLGEATHGS